MPAASLAESLPMVPITHRVHTTPRPRRPFTTQTHSTSLIFSHSRKPCNHSRMIPQALMQGVSRIAVCNHVDIARDVSVGAVRYFSAAYERRRGAQIFAEYAEVARQAIGDEVRLHSSRDLSLLLHWPLPRWAVLALEGLNCIEHCSW